LALVIAVTITHQLMRGKQEIAQALQDMLRL
jgi:hypothetical protein